MDIKLIQQELDDIKQDIIKAQTEIGKQKIQMDRLNKSSTIVGWIFTGVILVLTTLLIITIIRGI